MDYATLLFFGDCLESVYAATFIYSYLYNCTCWNHVYSQLFACHHFSTWFRNCIRVAHNSFNIFLRTHIVAAVITSLINIFSVATQKRSTLLRPFFLAILSCSGFVVLKLLDLHLVQFSPLFKTLSGHFWSKLCGIQPIVIMQHLPRLTLDKYCSFWHSLKS